MSKVRDTLHKTIFAMTRVWQRQNQPSYNLSKTLAGVKKKSKIMESDKLDSEREQNHHIENFHQPLSILKRTGFILTQISK